MIINLQQVLGTSASASYKILYALAIILFLLVVLLCILLFQLNRYQVK
ncbi:Putative L-lactate permease (fragment) [Xenorhabdus bovienii SS-2004]|uniref:Putative L-lactate permease n=1 Tax=Xenorhabdus bovienii (strain SS-2004) TaxID=406818 RepID=D3UZD9_XENBS